MLQCTPEEAVMIGDRMETGELTLLECAMNKVY